MSGEAFLEETFQEVVVGSLIKGEALDIFQKLGELTGQTTGELSHGKRFFALSDVLSAFMSGHFEALPW